MDKLYPISRRAHEVRAQLVAGAERLFPHGSDIHYSEVRPYYRGPLDRFPYTLDCSGAVIRLYEDAGAPDPSGMGFDGYGNTDTILAHLPPVSREQARRGDLVLFHVGNDGRHVSMLLEVPRYHKDPWVFSQGSEYGPLHIPLSSEVRYHTGQTVTFLLGVPRDL